MSRNGRRSAIRIPALGLSIVLAFAPGAFAGKSYSSGGGHSYSSSSSHSSSSGSHSSSSSSSRSSGSHSSSSSGSSSRPSGSSSSSKSFSSGSKSYSSGSSSDTSSKRSYSSGKSYSSGASTKSLSSPPRNQNGGASSFSKPPSDNSFSFDTAAAHAKQEQESKSAFNSYKASKTPPVIPNDFSPRQSSASPQSTTVNSGGGNRSRTWSRGYTYVPDVVVIQTRPRRIYDVFSPYSYRPWVSYSDPYSSLFWWWLLDRSLDDQAWWAYHHRYDMDPARYQALLAQNQQLEQRVSQVESQQTPRDPTYTPAGLDRDLMYSDQYIQRAYSNRPTRSGQVGFWLFGVPLAAGCCAFFIWLIWFKRWQTST